MCERLGKSPDRSVAAGRGRWLASPAGGLLVASSLLIGFFTSRPLPAQDYQLVEPTGVITGDVYVRRGRMVVNDADGNQYVFQRDREFDSYDGKYVGYWLPNLNRVVRLPRSGRGLMQVADLDDFAPRYVYSRRSVRPARGGGPGLPPAYWRPSYVPPQFISPYGYGYGYQSFGTSLNVGGFGPRWSPRWRPGFGVPPLRSIVLESNVVPREPLPPVTVSLKNSGPREIRVTINDLMESAESTQVRIPANGTKPMLVRRDAGADLVKLIQTYAPDGSVITREVSTPIPPQPRYELVVHEWTVQSVAIDRTGKSPNVIEDVNYQGKGVGRFQLPPGDRLTGGTIDVLRVAAAQQNQGSVAPIRTDSDDPVTRPLSPLEKMLQQQRGATGRR
jgi:hypothetical protein